MSSDCKDDDEECEEEEEEDILTRREPVAEILEWNIYVWTLCITFCVYCSAKFVYTPYDTET